MEQEILTAPSRMEQLKNAAREAQVGLYEGAAVLASVAVAMGMSPDRANAMPAEPEQALPAPSLKITATFGNKVASAESIASSRITVLENIRAKGTPKAAVRRAERNGDCFNVGKGTEHPVFWNQGRNVDRKHLFGKDTRKSRVCEIGGKLIRIACHNEVRLVKPRNTVETPVVFVRSFAHTKLKVKANAVAVAKCETTGSSAYAVAEASASGKVYARTLVKGKGRGTTTAEIGVKANAAASAKARVRVSCKGEEVVIITEQPPQPPVKPPVVCNPNIEVCAPPPPPPPPPNNPPPPPPPPPPEKPPITCDPVIDTCNQA